MDLYQSNSNCSPGIKKGPAPGSLILFYIDPYRENLKNRLVWKQKAQAFDIWYIAIPNGPLPRLFKLLPWGEKWPRPEADMFYIDLPASVAQLDARPTEDQEDAGLTPAEVGNILSWRLIMKYFLWSFSPFRWFKKGSCQFLAKECAQYWLTT